MGWYEQHINLTLDCLHLTTAAKYVWEATSGRDSFPLFFAS